MSGGPGLFPFPGREPLRLRAQVEGLKVTGVLDVLVAS